MNLLFVIFHANNASELAHASVGGSCHDFWRLPVLLPGSWRMPVLVFLCPQPSSMSLLHETAMEDRQNLMGGHSGEHR